MKGTIEKTTPNASVCIDPADNRRRHLRTTFTVPLEFKIFTRNPVMLKGYLKDISLGGSCLEFDDPYKRIIVGEALHSTVRLSLGFPGSEKMVVLAKVQWISSLGNSTVIRLGIAFSDLTQEQLERIQMLIGMKNKDHNMLWNMWEEYQSQSRD